MWKFAAVAVAGALLGAFGALYALAPVSTPGPAGGVTVSGRAAIGGPFSLVDHRGAPVTEKDLTGHHSLVFFGFTNCPDICPSGLQTAAEALRLLGPKAAKVTPYFVTLDPERDTPERLAAYVRSFDPRLIGLTGSREQVDAAAKAYRVYAKKTEPEPDGSYSIDHSSFIYLMGPDGAYLAHFAHGEGAAKIADRLNRIL